jgi:hypothetical protein
MNVDYKLLEIKEESFSVNDIKLTKTEAQKKLVIGIGFAPGVDIGNEIFVLDFIVSYKYKSTDNILLSLEYKFVFKVKDIKNIAQKLEDGFEIDDDFLASTINVAIGTMRGIIYSKTSGSELNKFILPLFDTSKIIVSAQKKSK